MVEFKTLARRDAFERMDQELKLLFDTVPDDRKEVKSSCLKVREFQLRYIWLSSRPNYLCSLQLGVRESQVLSDS